MAAYTELHGLFVLFMGSQESNDVINDQVPGVFALGSDRTVGINLGNQSSNHSSPQ